MEHVVVARIREEKKVSSLRPRLVSGSFSLPRARWNASRVCQEFFFIRSALSDGQPALTGLA